MQKLSGLWTKDVCIMLSKTCMKKQQEPKNPKPQQANKSNTPLHQEMKTFQHICLVLQTLNPLSHLTNNHKSKGMFLSA